MSRKPLLLLLVALQLATLLAVVFVRPAPAGVPQAEDFSFAVVRAYYSDLVQVRELATWREPWEVNEVAGYIVLDATPVEQQQLRDLGFRVEVDLALTEELNRPRTALPNQGGGIPGYECYRTVEETFDTGAQLAADYPTLAEWIDIGDSWDKVTPGGPAGYDMMVLRLTNEEIPDPKPALYTSALSMLANMWLLNRLRAWRNICCKIMARMPMLPGFWITMSCIWCCMPTRTAGRLQRPACCGGRTVTTRMAVLPRLVWI